MPRTSPYVISLSPAEAAELQWRAGKYTLPYVQVQRAKMILLAAGGLNNDDIGARLNTPREVVGRWRKRFFVDRLSGLESKRVRVAPGLFLPDLVVQVKAWACELPTTHGLPLSLELRGSRA
jgi:hypothetical protein